jgi:hypothetical protein
MSGKNVRATSSTVVALTLSSKGNSATFSSRRKLNSLPLGRREDMMGTQENSAHDTAACICFYSYYMKNEKLTYRCSVEWSNSSPSVRSGIWVPKNKVGVPSHPSRIRHHRSFENGSIGNG